MKKFQSFGVLTPEESEREKKHKSLARRAAAEGYVLLKNEGLLPLQNKNIALYGAGSRRTVKGGSGSGDVYERHSVTIEEGLKMPDLPSRRLCGWIVLKKSFRKILRSGRRW